MKKTHSSPRMKRALTGIKGLDEITHGGLPAGRTTLLEGGPGSGKTILALQMLVNGVRDSDEPAIFVAFEESSERIVANAGNFGWNLPALKKKHLFFLDAQPAPELVHSGSFDLSGMLAALGAKVREMGARRIVIDAVDIVLALLENPAEQRREVYRLHQWLLDSDLTAIITSKAANDTGNAASGQPQLGFMQFMVDCAIRLNHHIVQGISQRSLRVVKYRGSSFAENEAPFLIGDAGVEVSGATEMGGAGRAEMPVSSERVSSGVERLDAMLGGGYFRGASILITGFPGTAKSTLGGSFAEAACKRGERTLYISFDSDGGEMVRNLESVNIQLAPYVKNGSLRLVSARTITGSAETHLLQIKNLAREHKARCVVIDPISALSKAGNECFAHSVAERLVGWMKSTGATVVCTSLLDEAGPDIEGTSLQISTIADTWIHLSYLVQAGERNRSLSIVKSRGTSHSHQVRELVLSEKGVTLADTYTAGGEVLMGTLRWEKERAVEAAGILAEAKARQKKVEVENEEALLEVRQKAVELELKLKRAEKETLAHGAAACLSEGVSGATMMNTLREADAK